MTRPGPKPRPLADRFWGNVDKNGPFHPLLLSRCWLWTAAKAGNGYGRTSVTSAGRGRYDAYAHRASWQMANGPIPSGLEVCHRCDNPPCVNPAHLFLATHQANVTDMVQKGRQRTVPLCGEINGRAKLTEADVATIRALYAEGRAYRQIAAEFAVTPENILHIAKRRTWKHVA